MKKGIYSKQQASQQVMHKQHCDDENNVYNVQELPGYKGELRNIVGEFWMRDRQYSEIQTVEIDLIQK